MLPSTVPPSEQLGYLFINPGGPGGSGTEAVIRFGAELQVILEGKAFSPHRLVKAHADSARNCRSVQRHLLGSERCQLDVS